MIASDATLTDRQLDGVACVVCSDEDTPMRPLPGWGPHGQLFRCSAHAADEADR